MKGLFEIECIISPNCYHGLEGFYRGKRYRATKMYSSKGVFFVIFSNAYGEWTLHDSCSEKTFNKFFKEIT